MSSRAAGGAGRRTVRIAPSILTADFGRLAEAARAAEEGGADLMHLDVMDGHFVPQITFGPLAVEAVRAATALPIEVHMMVADPEHQIGSLAEAGADMLVFHVEATHASRTLLARIRELGCSAGIAISPDTPAEHVEQLLDALDQIVVMLVHPGRGGQSMLVQHLQKVRWLKARAEAGGLNVTLEVDGGVKAQNAVQCVEAGADILVAGSAVYNDRETPQQALAALRVSLAEAEPSAR